ncbi:hypothetical membrane protein [Campylobacter iguaniorum]|uniref:Hypothetical membrane protein n=1 Tax=Campylobacter iguaniorum TaxID=1244531 RepID=A0A076FBH4_9BACT|nr:FxsA family protein [Campylobacter iguaniorum]AII14787.1 hypothetical membrane protein [Campylobacter iguaniorum]
MIRISLLPYLVIELICVAFYIANYGILNFFGEVFLSGILGVILLFNYGFSNFYGSMNQLNLKNIFGSMGIAFGGMLLIVPGILSDFVAIFVLLVSFTLKLVAYLQGSNAADHSEFTNTKSSCDSEIIDVEIIDTKGQK